MMFLDGPPRSDPTTYQVGDRVKLSELGKSRLPNAVAELGVVTALPKGKRSVWVRFDGNKSSTRIHASYIEPA
jgi:hypothetical protein